MGGNCVDRSRENLTFEFDTDWIDQVDIEPKTVAMAEEEQRARAQIGDSEADSDTDVLDVGEHGMVSRGAAMAIKSSRTYLRRLRRGSGSEGAAVLAPLSHRLVVVFTFGICMKHLMMII